MYKYLNIGSLVSFLDTSFFISIMNVRKKAKIRNRYNQVPHLTQATVWESDET